MQKKLKASWRFYKGVLGDNVLGNSRCIQFSLILKEVAAQKKDKQHAFHIECETRNTKKFISNLDCMVLRLGQILHDDIGPSDYDTIVALKL